MLFGLKSTDAMTYAAVTVLVLAGHCAGIDFRYEAKEVTPEITAR